MDIDIHTSHLDDECEPVELDGQWNSNELGHEEQMITRNDRQLIAYRLSAKSNSSANLTTFSFSHAS